MRTYKRREEDNKDPYRAQPLPVEKPVAVYYRQSSEAQIGNISTTLQTVDMVEHLVKLGWAPESVIMIDMDAGISGMKTIEERPGMSQVVRLIETQEVGAVAAQDIDRFFRDVTQIQPNIFIEACRQNNVLVLTPTMVFDFNHPMQGRYHMQMFRDHAQRAADYIEYHVRGRLVKARFWRCERGMWSGRKIAAGYMVDDRQLLPSGAHNPDYLRYVPLEPYAKVIRAYFKIFQQYNGCLEHAWRHIEHEGPFLPEDGQVPVPEGFIFKLTSTRRTRRSKVTGKLSPSRTGLRFILTNVVYIGHWVHQGAIAVWDNHEPIIEHDLFMYAFNTLSKTDFYGEPNPHHTSTRDRRRVPKEERTEEEPTYTGFVFSDDIAEHPHRRLGAIWHTKNGNYMYRLYAPGGRRSFWNIRAFILDPIIDKMLLERLQSTVVDEDTWQQALKSTKQGNFDDIRRLEQDIRREEKAKDNIIASLGSLSNPEMVKRAEAQYEAAARRIDELKAQVDLLHSDKRRQRAILASRPALEQIAKNWDAVPRAEKRNIFQEFVDYVNLTRISRHTKQIHIHWKDGTINEAMIVTRFRDNDYYWEKPDIALLCQMMDADMPQVDILRAFPGYTFKSLAERYAYHGTPDNSYKRYKGERPYTLQTRWEDTEEYRQQQQFADDENPESSESSEKLFSLSPTVPLRGLLTQACNPSC